MSYVFKPGAEMIWFLVVTFGTAIFQMIIEQGATAPTDWKTWLIAVGAACLRTIPAIVLHFTSHGGQEAG